MPCTDSYITFGYSPTRIRPRDYQGQAQNCSSQLSESVLLCSACRALKRLGYDFGENPALDRWWDEHQKEDAKREKRIKKKKL